MMSKQVTCIRNRGNHEAHERISVIGGRNSDGTRWSMTEDQAIRAIEGKKDEFYVSVNGRAVDVVIAMHKERKYLKTTADGYSPDNLLSLPECP